MVRRSPVKNTRRAVRRLPLTERRGVPTAKDRLAPPPVRGWNARDALSQMRPDEAVFLRNWFPKQSSLVTRPGYSSHCDTGTGAEVSQLVSFEYGAASKLLAFSDGGVYDVSTSSPSTVATGLTGDDWSYDYLGGYVLLANGADVLKKYDGTTWSNLAYSGGSTPTLSTLNHVGVFKSRAYFVEASSQSMWYSGVGAVSGVLTEFDFSTVAPVRGNLVYTTHLKGDGGDGGNDDIFIAIFEEGDALAYSGSNPGDPTDWALIGHYRVGRPLGRLAYTASSDDVYAITDRGYEKLSEIVRTGVATPEKSLLSYKIQREVSSDVALYGSDINWRAFMYQRGQMFIVAVPNSGSRRQHVQNINTGAWCEFRGIPGASWATWEGNAYFGSTTDGIVYAFDDGSTTDAGTSIRCDAQQAWTDMAYGSRLKQVELIRPFFYADYYPSAAITVGRDYDTIEVGTFVSGTDTSSSTWDVATWDVAMWSADKESQQRWFGRNALGSVIGWRVIIDTNSNGGEVEWNNTQVLFSIGGYI